MSQSSTTVEHPRSSHPNANSPQGLALVFYDRQDARVVQLEPGQGVVVGRRLPADIRFDDRNLSREHARLTLHEGELRLQDLRSTNGTWIGEQRIEQATLYPGDIARMGAISLSVHASPETFRQTQRIVSFGRFQQMLEDEVARAALCRRPASLLLVRRAGKNGSPHDWCPQLVSDLRPIDAAAVYGTETLAILLPETSEARASARARQAVAALKGSFSLGLACYPDAGVKADSLLTQAREAVTRAARAGGGLQVATAYDEPSAQDDGPVIVSPAMSRLYDTARRAARSALPILITGETGTGKELVARFIHETSPRAKGPLRTVNCAALPATLLESTLFGHRRGAFSGAVEDVPGLFEQAHGGTVFLDEVGELSPAAQAVLLRVLETKTVQRVGAIQERQVDIRIVTATHRELPAMCHDGHFRGDLLHRLNTITLDVPPLRERPEEIPPLAQRFLQNSALPDDCPRGISASALERLKAHRWPGNVRELRNTIERAAVLAEADRIEAKDLPEPGSPVEGRGTTRKSTSESAAPDPLESELPFRERLQEYEQQLIRRALEATGGNKVRAAELLKMPLRTFMKRCETSRKD